MLRSVVRSSAVRYVRTALQAIRTETDLQSQLQENRSCVVGFFEDEHESSRLAKTDLNTVSAEFANIPFFTVSGTQCPQLMRNHDIKRLPAIVAFREGDVLECTSDLDKNTMRTLISKLPDAKKQQSGGLFSSFFGGQQERQQEKDLEKRVEEAHDKNARKEWETSPQDAVYKKHPLRAPDTDTDNRAGLNTLASGLKEGYDEAMDEVAQRAKQQRKQSSDSLRRDRNLKDRKDDLNVDSGKQRSKGRARDLNEDDSSSRASTQDANKDVGNTTRRDRSMDNSLNRQVKNEQRSDSAESIQGSNQESRDAAESRHGELETAKRSIKSGSGNIDMAHPNDADAKRNDSSNRGASSDRRQSSSKSKTQNAQSTL